MADVELHAGATAYVAPPVGQNFIVAAALADGPVELRADIVEQPLLHPATGVGIDAAVAFKTVGVGAQHVVFGVAPDAARGNAEGAVGVDFLDGLRHAHHQLAGVRAPPVGKRERAAVFGVGGGIVKGCGVAFAVFGHAGGGVEVVVKVDAGDVVVLHQLPDALHHQLYGLGIAGVKVELAVVIGHGERGVFARRMPERQG